MPYSLPPLSVGAQYRKRVEEYPDSRVKAVLDVSSAPEASKQTSPNKLEDLALKPVISGIPLPVLWEDSDILAELRKPLAWRKSWGCGPHSRSNWLPVGSREEPQLCVGGWPFQLPSGYGMSDGETEEAGREKVRRLLEKGVTSFVNLTESNEFMISDKDYNYETWIPRVLEIAHSVYGGSEAQSDLRKTLRFDISCEMPDGLVTSDLKLATLLSKLLKELVNPERVLYIHCYGGHGRSGIVACSLLCLLYPGLQHLPADLTQPWAAESINRHASKEFIARLQTTYSLETLKLAEGAVTVFNRCHAERVDEHGGGLCRFPHSMAQFAQVLRVAAAAGPFADLRCMLGR